MKDDIDEEREQLRPAPSPLPSNVTNYCAVAVGNHTHPRGAAGASL
jgi:hypothetical protein